MQPAALPAPDEPGTWDDLTQPNNPRTDPAPVPPPPDHRAPGRSPQGRLRRRCAAGLRRAAARPGYARSLTCPPARHRHGQLSGKQETPVTHAPAEPPRPKHPSSDALDAAPLLQG